MPAVLNNAIDWLSRPYGAGAIVGKPFGVIGATPTPYGGKWAHDDARRSAGIAGAVVVDGIVVAVRRRRSTCSPTRLPCSACSAPSTTWSRTTVQPAA